MKTFLKFFTCFLMVTNMVIISSCSDDDDNDETPYTFEHAGHTYMVVKESKTWIDAAADAVEKGGYLVEIDDQSEQNAVYKGITDAGVSTSYTKVSDGGNIAYVWIGAADIKKEGEWLWNGTNSSGGTLFWKGKGEDGTAVNNSYVNWGGKSSGKFNEPDNFTDPEVSPEGQNAAAIGLAGWPAGSSSLGKAGEWNDIAETNKLYYVIEFE